MEQNTPNSQSSDIDLETQGWEEKKKKIPG